MRWREDRLGIEVLPGVKVLKSQDAERDLGNLAERPAKERGSSLSRMYLIIFVPSICGFDF